VGDTACSNAADGAGVFNSLRQFFLYLSSADSVLQILRFSFFFTEFHSGNTPLLATRHGRAIKIIKSFFLGIIAASSKFLKSTAGLISAAANDEEDEQPPLSFSLPPNPSDSMLQQVAIEVAVLGSPAPRS
jgi:hypothetical protein